MARILIVEDEEKIARFVTLELEHEGYQVEHAADGRTAVDLALERDYDLILLDVLLPQLNGMEVLRRVRKHKDVPVIMVTARDAVMDKVAGLDAGADDYLTKPFLMQELLLRVQHLLQRAYRTELRRSRVLTLGDCTVNLQDAAVRRADGTTLALTATERALLQRLADDSAHIVNNHAYCEDVWGADYYGYENSLNVHIRHLREKIEPDPGHPQWLLTVRGIGYRLTEEV